MNLKKFLNNKIFIFILGGLVFGTIGVSAATYFNSKDVTYDNKTSGLNATNVQTAIDELYNTCFPPFTIGGRPVEIVTTGDGLYKDEYEDRYFYRGTNPNNYITFNNETWRIISIEYDGAIKIMRNESIGNRAWDSSYSNNWTRPADLNTYLNGTYYNELNSTAQNQIVAKDWSIGAVTYDNNDLADQINNENESIWRGKVALITVSEYLRSNSNKSSCGTFSLNNDNYSSCKNSSWMYIYNDWYLLSPYTYGNSYTDVFYLRSDGLISTSYAGNTYASIYPAVYLSYKVQITGGDGSQSNPYLIK